VIFQDLLDNFIRWLLAFMMWDLLECLVGWDKECVIGLGSIQLFDQVRKLVDELSKLGSVLAVIDELIDGVIWFVVTMMTVMGVLWLSVRAVEEIKINFLLNGISG
jgi:hypothetical protein